MKKAPIAIALVLVFGLFAAAFSLAPAVAQYTPPSDTGTSSDGNISTNATGTANTIDTNTTTTATTNATGGTFTASGSIASLIFDTGETTTTSEVQNETTTASNETDTADNMTGNTTTSLDGNTTLTMPQLMTGDNETGSDDGFGLATNMTGTSNMTSSTNETSSTSETSTAAEEMEPPYVLAGDWNLDVQDGSVTDFAANFTMVHVDGTERHTHDLSNFVSSNSSTIDTSGNGTSFIFGTVDVATDGEPKWTGVDALIIIEKNNVISIALATEDTDDHFGGQPIYGVVDSMTDQDGNDLIQTETQAAGNTTGGNQTGGDFLSDLGEGVEDLFNGTGQ